MPNSFKSISGLGDKVHSFVYRDLFQYIREGITHSEVEDIIGLIWRSQDVNQVSERINLIPLSSSYLNKNLIPLKSI